MYRGNDGCRAGLVPDVAFPTSVPQLLAFGISVSRTVPVPPYRLPILRCRFNDDFFDVALNQPFRQ